MIALGVVGETLFPTGEENSNPFKSYRAHGGMVTFAASALGLVTGCGPRAITDRASAELMKALAQELWASAPKMDAGFFAAGSACWPDAAQRAKFAWVLETLPIGTKGC